MYVCIYACVYARVESSQGNMHTLVCGHACTRTDICMYVCMYVSSMYWHNQHPHACVTDGRHVYMSLWQDS
jgi:hypothetical protein